ncbi:hypothetical protein BDW59DRAFT_110694 [Aspergillus cavernicola]|uniref:Protein artemis n=1 Tax=Aspergillus cavernicola TaxID=176166 RepID=A0ABR4I0V3_9EURO
MSTFDGIIEEFPFITIDYFRKNPERPPPLACFLSHAHSDHLQGLESFRAPFIYCSAATRELLLRIEKYPHRMNFNHGILESRRLHYKHLSKLLRPIPLNTPTEIDLTPRLSIRVTLLDANHCTGAVMFLIEGDGKAIIYTGDIRAEPWWVDSLIRHPILIPYTLGSKRLDKLYLDTTFALTSHTSHTFPTKAEGIAELLRKAEPYPEDTIFYFRAWTFGYEDVWVALAAALKSKIHVDRYQMGLYRSVSSSCREGSGAVEAPSLCGFELGNKVVPGFLSGDQQSRIHSCEPGVHCPAAFSDNSVCITPIVSRTKNGSDVPEIGAGGGLGDLYQIHELELPDQSSLARLEQLCREKIHDSQALTTAREALLEAFSSKSKALSLDSYGMKDANEMPLDELVNVLSRGRLKEESIDSEDWKTTTEILDKSGKSLPRTIHFPYSRHSSYTELCRLVAAFKPRDIHPCTVDPLDWDDDISMENLFGHLCSDNKFVHDQYMRVITAAENGERPRKRARREPESSIQSTQQSTDDDSRASQSIIQTITEADNFPTSEPRNHPVAPEAPSSRSIIIPSSPTLTSQETPLPASLVTIEDPANPSDTNSLRIPTPSPGAAKARRKTIRQAWHLLQDAKKSHPNQFHLGSLPSSWPTDRDNSLPVTDPQALDEIVQDSSQVTSIRVPSADNPEPTSDGLAQEKKTPPTTAGNITETDMDMDNEYFPDSDREEHQTNPYPSSQQSHTPTVSSSLFDSQSQIKLQRDGNEHELITDEEYTSENELEHGLEQAPHSKPITNDQTSNSNPETQPRPSTLPRRESSIQNRRAAYLAAREDSYQAWASMSFVSAGNNHTEEEVEL